MKFIQLFLFTLIFAYVTKAQQYPLVTLHDVNFIPDSSLSIFPPSPMAGDTVRIRGIVTVAPVVSPVGDRRPIIWVGARWGNYIQDPEHPEWGGMNIFQNDSVTQGTLFDLVDTASVYEFTGIVTPYFQSTEFVLITAPSPIPIEQISSSPKRPDPIPLIIDSLFSNATTGNYQMRKYQGVYVELKADATHDLITSDRVTGTGSTSGNFKINDGKGKFLYNYAQSTFFKSNSNGIRPSYQPPADGSYLSYIRGILTMRTDAAAGVAYWIVPLYPGDIGPNLVTPPSITNVKRDPAIVGPNQAVTISCTAKPFGATLTNVVLYSKVNGGQLDSLEMTKSSGDTLYTAVIPGVADSALVEYYVKAFDSNGLSVANPANINASKYFYLVLNRPLTLQDVRYTPYVSAFSGYNNYQVSGITGVVIADTSDLPGSINRGGSNPARVYIQNGSGPWSGILLGTLGANGIQVLSLKRGDKVTVSGTVMLAGIGTKIDSITNLQVVSSNNPLPAPQLLTTEEIGVSVQGAFSAEKWNGTLVKYKNVVIDSLNADGTSNFGESYGNDGTLPHTRLIWSDGNTHYHNGWNTAYIGNSNYISLLKGDKFTEITGVLGYTHAYYKLAPRKDDDIVGYISITGVETETKLPQEYVLKQNYPNPFNPSTVIEYSIPDAGLVTVKIFNVLGQEVKTLVNQFQNAGNYKVNFNAGSLTSGIYFCSFTSGKFNQVKKLLLLK